MRLLRPINLRRLALVLGVLTLCVSLGGCSLSRRKRIYFVTQAEIAAGGQPYFVAGDITYQVQISRQLRFCLLGTSRLALRCSTDEVALAHAASTARK